MRAEVIALRMDQDLEQGGAAMLIAERERGAEDRHHAKKAGREQDWLPLRKCGRRATEAAALADDAAQDF